MDVSQSLAEAWAARLGGVAGIGIDVHSDADMAGAVAGGFRVKAIDVLKEGGCLQDLRDAGLVSRLSRPLTRTPSRCGSRG